MTLGSGRRVMARGRAKRDRARLLRVGAPTLPSGRDAGLVGGDDEHVAVGGRCAVRRNGADGNVAVGRVARIRRARDASFGNSSARPAR